MAERYIGTHMHLHSCYEETASMEGQCYQARRIGIEALFISDHDTYMGARIPNNGCTFDDGLQYRVAYRSNGESAMDDWYAYCGTHGMANQAEMWRREKEEALAAHSLAGWHIDANEGPGFADVETSQENPFVGRQCMQMTAAGLGQQAKRVTATFRAGHKGYNRTLLARVHIGIALRCAGDFLQNARFSLGFRLSQHPCDSQIAQLRYAAGVQMADAPGPIASASFDLKADGAWHYYVFHVSQDAEAYASGGLDNALNGIFCQIETNSEKRQSIWIDHLTIWDEDQLDVLHRRQAQYLQKIGRKYGVAAYAAVEVSESGHHMTSFSGDVPVLDYPMLNYQSSEQIAIEHIRTHNGAYSYNHPFSRFRRLTMTGEERAKAKAYEIGRVVSTHANGADFLEVGFPEGRYSFSFDDFMELWDCLSRSGAYITGYGDSDSHWNDRRWEEGNNMAAFIWAASPKRDELLKGLRSGNVYSADPIQFKAALAFGIADTDIQMGSVVACAQPAEFRMYLKLSGMQKDWRIFWIDDGAVSGEAIVEAEDALFAHTYAYKGMPGFCRAEIRRPDGRCIAFTNPIYFAQEGAAPPKQRRVVSPRPSISCDVFVQ